MGLRQTPLTVTATATAKEADVGIIGAHHVPTNLEAAAVMGIDRSKISRMTRIF